MQQTNPSVKWFGGIISYAKLIIGIAIASGSYSYSYSSTVANFI